ncbi:unnamed protein product [Somion occarium]|uniref:Transforming growth factor beta regulator 1 n=1 Tax=Somion occarium TaxID=3059160 RepID=A0ABP1DZ14_9APHY
MSRSSRSHPQNMPPPDAIMGPPPLPPTIVFTPSQAPAPNAGPQASSQKSSHPTQDVGEKYSRLKRKYFELDEKFKDAVIEMNSGYKRSVLWRNERTLLLDRIMELENNVLPSPNSFPSPISSAYPRSLSNPRAQKMFIANLDQGIMEAEMEDLDEDPLMRSRHIGPHIRKRQEAEQRERQEEEAREAKRQARRPRGSGAAQKQKETNAAASTSRNENSHHHNPPLQYAHSPSGQRDSPWLVSETGTRLRLKPPAPPPSSAPEPGAELSMSAHHAQIQSEYQTQPQTYQLPPPPPPPPSQFRAASRTPPEVHNQQQAYSQPQPQPQSQPQSQFHSPSLAQASSHAQPPAHAHSSPQIQISHTPQPQVQPSPRPEPQPQSQSQFQSQSHVQQQPQPQPKHQERSESPFPIASPHEEKHTFLTMPPLPLPPPVHQQPPQQPQQHQQQQKPIILEPQVAHPQPQVTLQPVQQYVTLSPSADYRATPMDPNKAAQSQMQITLRPMGGNGTPTGRPSELQRHAKPKRLKAHTVTSKSYSIPMVPRDKDGKPLLPLNVGIMTVYNLGEICRREHFHTERYIFPIGYEVTRRYYSTVDPTTEVNYRCKILDGGDGPKFQIIADDNREDPVLAGTATGAWSTVVKAANSIRSRQHSNSVSGPDFFGLGQNTIKHLIQELPGANELKNYVWQKFVEGGPLGGRHAAVIPALPDEAELNGSQLIQALSGIEHLNRVPDDLNGSSSSGSLVGTPGNGYTGGRRRDKANRDVTSGNGMATHYYSEQQGELIEIEDGERPRELQIIQVDSEDIHNGQPARPRSNTASEYAIPPPPPPDPAQHNRKERRGRKSSRVREQHGGFEEYVVPDSNMSTRSPSRQRASHSQSPALSRADRDRESHEQQQHPPSQQQIYSPHQQHQIPPPPPSSSRSQTSQSPYLSPPNGRGDAERRTYFAGSPPPPPPPIPATFASIMNAYPAPPPSPRSERKRAEDSWNDQQ